MYCPGCGIENTDKTRFCRSCGVSLEVVSKALASGTSPGDLVPRPAPILDRTGWQNPVIYALLLILVGIAVGLVGNKVAADQSMKDIGTLIALLGVGLLGLKGVRLIMAPPGYSSRSEEDDEEFAPGLSTPLLHPEPPAVTETTTRHLDAVSERVKDDSRDTHPQ